MHNALDAGQKQRVTDLLLDGMTVSQVVRETGISRSSVNKIANAMRAEGLPVMRAAQGRRPKVAA